MEWSLAVVIEFLTPLLEANDLSPDDVYEVIFRHGGAEIVTYVWDDEGKIQFDGNEILFKHQIIRYNI